VRVDRVGHVQPAEGELVGLQVGVLEPSRGLASSSSLREEPRGPQHHARHPCALGQLAEVLGRGLGDAVDVLGDRPHVLVDPGGRLAGRGFMARPNTLVVLVKTKAPDARLGRRLQQVQRAADVDVDEVLAAVGRHVRLVQGGGVDHRAAPAIGRATRRRR
jgi:hypothetical protein